ncbi:sugar phosphate isomerase/epimerase family protein [Saccharibacillus alkalitolerans]|uniref:Sugar phosphate isomerase/epimerase n=1 Tax=Saccharibacillus alkalitolerans TaxID=2705290 RepID=A0ABX0F4L4_9BACL|nr:sugar phosphate isomerase/epimerase [Saccharibacillus alkalitolerans]NGZ74141.1 sugar phosphate isomerase/epimerase [Saccharibacillus alkalitolerans]
MAKVGLQLYTVREEMEQDFRGTLEKVAELGYKGVEFHTFFGRGADEVKSILDELGLEALGTHTAYRQLLDHLDEEIAYNKRIGNDTLIVPYLTEEERVWDEVFANLKELGRRTREQGAVLCYHNHDFEMTEEVNGKPVFDAMYEAVSADDLQVEMDTCWVHYGGYDPVEYINRYRGRLPIIHLKDMTRDADGKAITAELGVGEVNLTAIADAAIGAGVEWIVVEQDYCAGGKPLESIATSMEWIKKYAAEGAELNV